MPSPFLGMDPFTEARHFWKGIHAQLIGLLSAVYLPPLLSPAYFVDTEDSLQIESGRNIFPDVRVSAFDMLPTTYPHGMGLPVATATTTVTVELDADHDEDEDNYSAIVVREATHERLVAVIEILSYSNKTKGDEKRVRYLMKRDELLAGGAHLVEIDLLRWGQRVINHLPNQPYHILVTRGDDATHSRVWSFGFDSPIPTAPLPLIGADEYVPIPLHEAYAAVYDARAFRRRLDYTVAPPPPALTSAQSDLLRSILNP